MGVQRYFFLKSRVKSKKEIGFSRFFPCVWGPCAGDFDFFGINPYRGTGPCTGDFEIFSRTILIRALASVLGTLQHFEL